MIKNLSTTERKTLLRLGRKVNLVLKTLDSHEDSEPELYDLICEELDRACETYRNYKGKVMENHKFDWTPTGTTF